MFSLFPFLAYGYHEGYYHYDDPIHCFVTFLRYKYTTNFVSVNKLLSWLNKTIQNSHLHLTVIQLKSIDFGLVRVFKVILPFLKYFIQNTISKACRTSVKTNSAISSLVRCGTLASLFACISIVFSNRFLT